MAHCIEPTSASLSRAQLGRRESVGQLPPLGSVTSRYLAPPRKSGPGSRSDLPTEARQGDILRLEATIDHEATEMRREEVQAKIERLKHRSEDE